MTDTDTSQNSLPAPARPDWYSATAAAPEARPRLLVDQDVDVCVIGAGLAGLSVARAAAQRGATVVVLDSGTVGGQASGCHFGLVTPGFPVDPQELIARVGFDDAKALWALAQEGMERARADAARFSGTDPVDGWLQVSTVDAGEELIARLQVLGGDFGVAVEGWQVEQVRAALVSERYFHAVHYPRAFSLNAHHYLSGLAADAERHGARIYENSPVLRYDANGIRKRVETPKARLRASSIILAGNVHLGAASSRLSATLMPVWRTIGVTEPLGPALAATVKYAGAVTDTGQGDRYRIVDGDRLMWSARPMTWEPNPKRAAAALQARIAAAFPALGKVAFAHVWSGVYGQTIHGMPQIGELREGLWVASGFGLQGVNTSAIAGELVATGLLERDDRWRLFSPFELVWAGGGAGRLVGQTIFSWNNGRAAFAGALARYRERARRREAENERRLAAANRALQANRPIASEKPVPGDESAPT